MLHGLPRHQFWLAAVNLSVPLFLFAQFPDVCHQILDFRIFQALAIGRHFILAGGDDCDEILVNHFLYFVGTKILRSHRLTESRASLAIRAMTAGAFGFVGCRRTLRVHRRGRHKNNGQDRCEDRKLDLHIFHFPKLPSVKVTNLDSRPRFRRRSGMRIRLCRR
jgi:hypothetical protein